MDSRLVPIQTDQAAAVTSNAFTLEIKDQRVDVMLIKVKRLEAKIEKIVEDRRDEENKEPSSESSYENLFPKGPIDEKRELKTISDNLVTLIGKEKVENLQIVSYYYYQEILLLGPNPPSQRVQTSSGFSDGQ